MSHIAFAGIHNKGFREITPIMDNQMEKKMDNNIETGRK